VGDPHVLTSVVVTTCNQPSVVCRCVQSILQSAYPRLEVIVVENRPSGSMVSAALASAFPSEARVRYVEERRRGLSHARNRGIEEARGDIVVFTDDDVLVDRHWLAHIVEEFSASGADCVTGLILPVELETPAQRWLEEFGGFAKGFVPATYDLGSGADDPLYPYAAGRFGSGANTALLASTARDIGGFDPDLSAGTVSAGGEDLDLFIRIVRSGRRLSYQPSAIVWHRHHAELTALTRQLFHYGTGLSAALTKQLVAETGRGDLLRRVPRGAARLLRPDSPKNDRKSSGYPRLLTYAERLGFAFGPLAYLWTAALNRSGH
jgi:GT2 family glycosyltransferase